jgi:hypothetical protein
MADPEIIRGAVGLLIAIAVGVLSVLAMSG